MKRLPASKLTFGAAALHCKLRTFLAYSKDLY